MIPVSAVSVLFKKCAYQSSRICIQLNRYSSQNATADKKKLETLFMNRDVRKILYRITGQNYEKIFAPSQTTIKPKVYKFVTDEQLKELKADAERKAHTKLQMPPVMDIREPINEVLSKDPELQGYLRYKTIFTDLSTSVSNRDRIITVREIDGTLRKATWEERERMNQIFFPIPGRHLEVPKLFESPQFDNLLEESSYEYILDCACLQFEPDSPDYHKITNQTYEHIKQTKKFDDLRSTRHFGPMAFYFAIKKDIDSLLLDMMSRQLINDASDTIKLLYIIHPELHILKDNEANEIEILQDYIKNHSSQKDELELALQTLMEHQKPDLQQEATA
ncbi:28S ribosomal protein S22, mitochondrial [Caerostris darwini]|uniref:28S ribosomal protein S22, mitochondrial n=1 Tax=Caerostris darwini TaxID=1538125 RepID=A0AAV4V5E1_9ARAC|nr:28S ribosomal protein S22, mitochondrial [Caerostris darwini]